MEAPAKKTSENTALNNAIIALSRNIQSLRDFVEMIEALLQQKELQLFQDKGKHLLPLIAAAKEVMPSAFKDVPVTREQAEKACGGKIKVHIKENTDSKKTFEVTIPGDDSKGFEDAMKAMTSHHRSYELLYESTLISLLSSVELFFSRIMHFNFTKFPGLVGGKDKVFSFDELTLFGSVEDARTYLIESRVENLLRDSFEEWITQTKKMCNLTAGYLEPHWEELCETWQRRNLIIHNGGVVNGIYLAKVKQRKDKPLKKGDKLRVSPSYLRKRFDLFELNCLLLAFDLWKKLSPKDELRSNSLMGIGYDRLEAKNWQVAEGLSRFLAGEKNLPEAYQLVGKFNFWQSVKRQNRWSEIKEEVEQEEIDSKSARFRLAWYSLTERKDEFFKLLPSVLKSEEISSEELMTWPIFEDMRSDERYKKYAAKKTRVPKQITKK